MPTIAQTAANIQALIVTLYEGQPSASKWWCSGETRKTFLPKNFFDVSWIITDAESRTSGSAINGKTETASVRKAITASEVVSPRIPVSPM